MSIPPTATKSSRRRHGVQNAVIFTVALACFIAGIYAFSFVLQYTAVALAAGLVLISLSFFVPLQLIAYFDRKEPAGPGAKDLEP